ncbi:MAG: hypothetical protein RL220_333 [Bacteroidota bacterium]
MIGCVVVFMLFPGFDVLGWLPSRQIRKQIFSVPLVATDNAQCRLNCAGISTEKLNELISKGDVVYDKSETRQKPRKYYIENNGEYVIVSLHDENSIVEDYGNLQNPLSCQCPE